MKSLTKSGRLDQFGMTASIACAVHCAVLPLVITSLPLIGMEFLANVWVEITMILLALVIGAWSMTTSYLQHKNIVPIMVLLTGFFFIATGHFLWHELEAVMIPLGGFTIAAAHYINWKLSRRCEHDPTEQGGENGHF